MNDLDLLLQELDKSGSARVPVTRSPVPPTSKQPLPTEPLKPVQPPTLPQPPYDSIAATNAGPAPGSRIPVPASQTKPPSQNREPKGMSELDSLVRDLTDLKGLVGGVNGGDGSATIPEQSLASRQQNPLISRAPLNLAQENMRRPSEAAGQLERLMDDLSLEAGEILDSNRSGADVKQDSTSRSGGVDDGSGRSTGNSNDANSPSVSPANTDISKSDKAHPNDAEAIADPTSDGIARSREDGTFQSPSPSLPQSDSWQGIRLPERQTATDNLSAQPSGPLKEAKNTSPKSCAVCNQPLSGPIVNAMGRAYHPEHFKCYNCSRLLGNGRFFEKEGNAFCESCWQVNLPKCAYCDGPITERCITALGQHWHPNHFFCAQCGKSFPPGAGFLEKDGMAYCEEDYFALFAMHCGGCGKGIIGEFVSACGKEWHMGCFVCVDCKQPFPTGTFYEHHGLPYCATHHALRRGNQPGFASGTRAL